MRSGAGLKIPIGVALLLTTAAQGAGNDAARPALKLGTEQLLKGDPRGARVALMNATSADPGWALPWLVSARAALALGDAAGGAAALERAVANGADRAEFQHLALHIWFLQGKYRQVLAVPVSDALAPSAQGYAYRIRALAAAALGDPVRAYGEFDVALKHDPNQPQTWADLGRIRALDGNIAGAIEAAARANRLDPRNTDALILRGSLVRGQFGLLAAIPWFEKILEVDLGHIPAMLELAATLGEAGRGGEMLDLTKRVQALDPRNAMAFYLQAVLAARNGRNELAQALIYKTAGRLDGLPGMIMLKAALALGNGNNEEVIAWLGPLLKMQPANLRVRQLLGTAMARAGDPRSAIATLTPIADRPDADSYTLSIIGRACEETGDRMMAARYLDRAMAPVRGDPVPFAVDLPPSIQSSNDGNAAIVVPRIAAATDAGRFAEALTEAVALRTRNPGSPDAHVIEGDVLMAAHRLPEAVIAYKRAASMRFSEPEAMRLILAMRAAGQGEEASRSLSLYLTQNPLSVPALRLAAEGYVAAGRWNEAIDVIESLHDRMGKRDVSSMASLGWAWYSRGDTAKGSGFLRVAYGLAPANPAVADSYGWVLFKSGQNRTAGINLLRKAVAIAPGHPVLRAQLATALLATGAKAEAATQLRAALEEKEFPGRADAVAMLEQAQR